MAKNPSRATRFDEAIQKVADARSSFEELRDELQNWYDNLPENLQSGMKADALQDAISSLEDVISDCENVESATVEFPGMFG